MIYEHFLNGKERVFRIVVKLLESDNVTRADSFSYIVIGEKVFHLSPTAPW